MEQQKKALNQEIEALRGYAALMVLFSHIVLFPEYWNTSGSLIGTYSNIGHFSVLVFFVLSGYVIGSVYKPHKPANPVLWAKKYLSKRFLRIYPIYLVAIILGVCACTTDGYKLILANLVFLQGIVTKPIFANAPLWTLGFEIFYYILFVFVFLIGTPLAWVASASIVYGVVGYAFNLPFSGVFIGYIFWLAGLYIAHYLPKTSTPIQYQKLISLLLFFFVIADANGLYSLSYKVLPQIIKRQWVHINDIFYLIPVLFIFLHFCHHTFKWLAALKWISFLSPLPYFLLQMYKNAFWGNSYLCALLAIYLLSVALWVLPSHHFSAKMIQKLSLTGAISYAIYAVHFPLMHFCGKIPFLQTPYLYVFKAVILCFMVLLLAYVLEKKFQPFVKNLLMPNPPEAKKGTEKVN